MAMSMILTVTKTSRVTVGPHSVVVIFSLSDIGACYPRQHSQRVADERALQTLGRRWGDRTPATRALAYIRVVALGIVAIIPGGRRRRLDRHRGCRLDRDGRRWGNDNGWVGIGCPVRVPVRVPVRPNGHANT